MTLHQAFLAACLSLLVSEVAADDVIDQPPPAVVAECPRILPEEPLATEYGSAGVMKNMAETEDSIKAIASRLLEQALTVENRKPAAGCGADCPDDGVAEVIYRVAPMSFLPRAQQNAVCLEFERETALEPLRFAPPTFGDLAALNGWLADLSQGRGEDGERLYARCSSNCSPRYTFHITSSAAGYDVSAEILCGLARDKSDDQYLISTALRRSCARP